jgi:anthranilate synthase component I
MAQAHRFSFCSDVEVPVALFHKLRGYYPNCFLLESTEGDSRLARYSFIGIDPLLMLRCSAGKATLKDQTGKVETLACSDPLALLETLQNERFAQMTCEPIEAIPFQAGWVGVLGYGATAYFDHIPQQSFLGEALPDAYYGFYDSVIVFDHLFRRLDFISSRTKEEALALWKKLEVLLQETRPALPLVYPSKTPQIDVFSGVLTSVTREQFCEQVLSAKRLIEAGELFQLVVAQRFSLLCPADPLDVYRTLQAINPSPYAYYLQFEECVYLGSSPETLVNCQNRRVKLNALAGTRPRALTESEDIKVAEGLQQNEKELAEHHMLVDLDRNDLGRVCEVGSLRVGEVARLIRYTHVMHLATEISGTLRADKSVFDLLRSCFPRGTVSGAPKIRAMQTLAKLEPEPRGLYSGAVGYFDTHGNMDSAIAIRSALIINGMAHVHAGAGVVYDSDPMMEYEETRNKAKSILTALQWANATNKGDL